MIGTRILIIDFEIAEIIEVKVGTRHLEIDILLLHRVKKIISLLQVPTLTSIISAIFAEGTGGAAGGGVAVVDPRHLQQLLGDGGRDDAGTAGGGDEAHPDGAALAGHLAGHGVRAADLVAPEAAPHGHDGELGEDDRAADGGGHLLGALYAIFPCLLLNNCSSLNCTALRDILPFFAGGSILLLSSVSFSETVGS